MPHAFATLASAVIVGPGKKVISAVGPEPRMGSGTTMTGMGRSDGTCADGKLYADRVGSLAEIHLSERYGANKAAAEIRTVGIQRNDR
jgi:hypothetical protein